VNSKVSRQKVKYFTPLSTAVLVAKMYTIGQASPLSSASNRSIAVTTSFSRSVAQVMLSTVAGIHTATVSIQEADINVIQATYIPWAPLGLFAGLVVVYAVLAGWICLDVWQGARVPNMMLGEEASQGSGRLQVAASRLTEPGLVAFDVIGSVFGATVKKEMSQVRLILGRRRDGAFGVHV
jgi:hypothetical protein